MALSLLPEGDDPVNCGEPGWMEGIVDALLGRGIAVYENLSDPMQLVALAEELGEVFFHRDGNEHGFTSIVGGEPGVVSGSQFLHTDSAGEEHPPDLLVVHCLKPADSGGDSLMADARLVCQVLKADHAEAFAGLQDPEIGSLRSGANVYRGPFLAEMESGRHYFRFRPDNEERSPVLEEHLTTIVHASGTVTERLLLSAGSGYVAQNERWLHGRTSWVGRREALRLLINVSRDSGLGARVAERGFELD
jgi:hypothetical protein